MFAKASHRLSLLHNIEEYSLGGSLREDLQFVTLGLALTRLRQRLSGGKLRRECSSRLIRGRRTRIRIQSSDEC